MLRVAVTYCLVLVTAAGPWLCCCASSRMTGTCHALQSLLGASGCGQRGCCGHGPSRDLPQDGDKPSPSAPGDCPCKAFAPSYAVLPPKPVKAADLASGDAEHLGLSKVWNTPFAIYPSLAAPSLKEWDSSRHSGAPRDILAVLQTLRC
jgi:hypothetical protein